MDSDGIDVNEHKSLLHDDGNPSSSKSHLQGSLKTAYSLDQNSYEISVENTGLRETDSGNTEVQDLQTQNNTSQNGSDLITIDKASSPDEQSNRSVQEEEPSHIIPAVACSSGDIPEVDIQRAHRNSTPRSDIALKNISITVLKVCCSFFF